MKQIEHYGFNTTGFKVALLLEEVKIESGLVFSKSS